ncbi:MAG: transcription termination factor Rho [Phycisphaerales bacterium]
MNHGHSRWKRRRRRGGGGGQQHPHAAQGPSQGSATLPPNADPQRDQSGNQQGAPGGQARISAPGGKPLPPQLDFGPLSPLKPFDQLTSIDPQPRLTLEYPGCPASCRLIDLFCPVGRGQRGLIVSPPKAGKTTLLKDIATGVLRNHKDVYVVVLLIDERPEEVTDFKRTFAPGGPAGAGTFFEPERCRVLASSNDHGVERHIEVAMQTIDTCKRLCEAGRHVVVVLDSLTRLGRAFNQSRKHASSGRTLTGGLDSRALEVPKLLFGAARNSEEAGSLTIIASCLVDTGSAGDQIIFEEFKGTGNMELILDRKISEQRIFPSINLAASGTRKEHLLMSEREMNTMTALRRRLLQMPPPMQIEQLLNALKRFKTNDELVGSAGDART